MKILINKKLQDILVYYQQYLVEDIDSPIEIQLLRILLNKTGDYNIQYADYGSSIMIDIKGQDTLIQENDQVITEHNEEYIKLLKKVMLEEKIRNNIIFPKFLECLDNSNIILQEYNILFENSKNAYVYKAVLLMSLPALSAQSLYQKNIDFFGLNVLKIIDELIEKNINTKEDLNNFEELLERYKENKSLIYQTIEKINLNNKLESNLETKIKNSSIKKI